MNSTTTSSPAVQAVVAAALHRVFASTPHAADSLELWLAITAEAVAQLRAPGEPPRWMPMHLIYRKQRTEARYDLATAAVRITSGPLTGRTYTDLTEAAYAVAVTYPGTDATSMDPVPRWRLDHTPDSHAPAPAAAHR